MAPVTSQVETLRASFKCGGGKRAPWYKQSVDGIQKPSEEESMLKLVLEEMAQFYDIVNDREFKQIEQKYAGSRIVLCKVGEKIEEMDK